MLTLEDVFPPFALAMSCGPVELKVLRDDDLPELVELVVMQDVHAENFAQTRVISTGSPPDRAAHAARQARRAGAARGRHTGDLHPAVWSR